MKQNVIGKFFTKWVLTPIKTFLAKRRAQAAIKLAEKTKAQELAELKLTFTKNFGVDPDTLAETMSKVDTGGVYNDAVKLSPEDYRKLLAEELRESAKLYSMEKGPMLYDPEMVNIHNEYLEENTGVDIQTLKVKDNKDAEKNLQNQNRLYHIVGVAKMKEVNRKPLDARKVEEKYADIQVPWFTPTTKDRVTRMRDVLDEVKKKFKDLT